MVQTETRARHTKIMAILNVTPDSFSDGGLLEGLDVVLRAAEQALNAGADILDIGGESTRPGAVEIPAEEECQRVLPVIEAIHTRFPEATLSIDTRKALVAEQAVAAGARIINDVSGLQFDENMLNVVAQTGTTLVLMHSQGIPETMQQDPSYPNGVVEAVYQFFTQQLAKIEAVGVAREKIILDPGFGFGKTLQHNLTLLNQLAKFQSLGCPILVGSSRKSFLTLGDSSIQPHEREALTAASLALAIERGTGYVRVHDVVTQAPVVRLIDAVLKA